MNKAKLIFTGMGIIALLGISLAFKKAAIMEGSVYCTNTCAANSRVDYRVDPNGSVTAPCPNSQQQPYVLVGNTDCYPTSAGTHFTVTAIGK